MSMLRTSDLRTMVAGENLRLTVTREERYRVVAPAAAKV